MRLLFLAALTALAALFAGGPSAHALTYQNGDLFLGVRASGGDGVADDFLIDIGPASQFIGKTSPFTVPNLGNLGAAIAAIYGSDWSSRDDVFWSISGGNLPADPENTLYATRKAAGIGQQPLPWLGDSNSAQGVVITKFNALAGAYVIGTAAAGTPTGTRQHAADPNSYASFQPGGTVQNSNGQSFAYFSPSIEASFAGGPAASVLDLIQVTPVYQQFGQDLGSFTLDASGVLTFTPAPATATVQFRSATYSVDEDSGAARAFVTLTRGGNLSVPFTV
ncbi:MAG TPA: hypothetical protein VGO11_14930, partial [Chthoniobacteraceae bacterium]|nr:hypothetical protein [Chthoniobacteraceae bacterium]